MKTQITAELLLKNDFRIAKGPAYENAKHPTYAWGEKGKRNFTMVSITIYNEPINGVRFLTKIENDSKHESGINMIHSCDIEDAEELQTALRLCGINKTIKI